MSKQFDSAWLYAHEARHSKPQGGTAAEGCDKESKLHEQIFSECRRRGWIALHGSMSERTHRTKGESDFCCLLPNGIVIFVECKTRLGKLTPEQSAMSAWMAKLGHKMHVVRHFSDFVLLVKNCSESDLGSSSSSGLLESSGASKSFTANATAEGAVNPSVHGSGLGTPSHAESQDAKQEQRTDFLKRAKPTSDGKQ